MFCLQCAVCSVQSALCSVQWAVCSVQYGVWNVPGVIIIWKFAAYNVLSVVCPRSLYSVTQDNSEYNALEQDLAVVNLYFGPSFVYGQRFVWKIIFFLNICFYRVQDLKEVDSLWLHRQPWWTLRPLSGIQHCFPMRDCLLVHRRTLHERQTKDNVSREHYE